MPKKDYTKEIQTFIEEYQDGIIKVSPGVSYSMREVNENSHLLYNGQFKTGKTEPSGFERMFARKAWVVYRTLVQNSDLDLKHLNIRSTNGIKVKLTALLRLAFLSHLGRIFFGEFIDDVLADMCWFGSSIVKRANGGVYLVDNRNYITEPTIQNPQERRHLEMCQYTYEQAQAREKDWDNWDAVERVWEATQKQGKSQLNILEFWTFDEDGHKICVKALDNTITRPEDYHNRNDWTPYVQLEVFRTPYKKKRLSKFLAKRLGEEEELFPYEQFDLFKVKGRQQAFGVAELLLDVSIAYNLVTNTALKGYIKATKGIYIHNAIQGVNGLSELLQENISNLLEGGVISLAPGETMQNFPFETRMQEYDLLESKLYELMRQIIGITAQGTGEEVPASTSATQAAINQQVAQTVYDFVRERMQHGLHRLFNNGFAEDILNEITEEEMIAIVGDPVQLQEIDNFYIENALNKWAQDYKMATGMYPTQQEYDQAKLNIQKELQANGDTRFAEIKKEVIKDLKYLVEFDITQEAVDYKGRFDALMALKNDPTSSKSKAKIEDEILTMQGLNPRNYDKTPEERQAEEEAMRAEQAAQSGVVQAPAPLAA